MSRSRSTAFSARLRAPRGGGGRGAGARFRARFAAGFLAAFRSGKQPLHGRGDTTALGAPGKAHGGDLHHLAETLRSLGFDLRDDAAQLSLELLLAERRGQVRADQLRLLLLLRGGGRPATIPKGGSRLLSPLHLALSDSHHERV